MATRWPWRGGPHADVHVCAGRGDPHAEAGLYLVAPDAREAEVRAQLARPAFARVSDLRIGWLAYGDLAQHRASIARFGAGMKAIQALARPL